MAKPLTLPSAASLPAVLLEQAARQGRRVALRHKRLGVWRERSWAELADEVGRLAAALAGLGLGPGQRLLALTPPRPQTALLSLAAHWLGAEVAALRGVPPDAWAAITCANACAALPRLHGLWAQQQGAGAEHENHQKQ